MLHINTPILTPSGFCAIGDIPVGGEVTTISGKTIVLKNEVVTDIPLLRVRVGDVEFLCSDDHQLLLFDPTLLYYYGIPNKAYSIIRYGDSIFEMTPLLDVDVWTVGTCCRLHLTREHNIIVQGNVISRAH